MKLFERDSRECNVFVRTLKKCVFFLHALVWMKDVALFDLDNGFDEKFRP